MLLMLNIMGFGESKLNMPAGELPRSTLVALAELPPVGWFIAVIVPVLGACVEAL
jgi:hypothetical protein